MVQDLGIGMRMLLKRPGLTLVAVLTLALGIGSTAAVFSLIQGVLLTPPPYAEPDRMILLSPIRTDGNREMRAPDWAAAHWLEWQETATTLEALAAYRWTFNFLVSPDGSESLEGMVVSQDYFEVLGLTPVLGRAFEVTDTASGAAPVVILGHELWQRRFDSDPEILGKPLRLSRQETPPTIIGVMPPDVRFLPSPRAAQEPNYNIDAKVDFWVPSAPSPESMRRRGWNVVGRLVPGVTEGEAQAELMLLVKRQEEADPELGGATVLVRSLPAVINREGRKILLPLLGAAGLVLLIACGNAAALLLIRGLERQREYAVRSAMGADRGALIRQVSVESFLMAVLGGALGVALAVAIVRTMKGIAAHAIPRLDAVGTGWPILAFGLLSALLAALLAGLYPAIRAARLSVVDSLQSASTKSSAGAGERRLLAGVTMTQTALTLALLIGAGLLIRTLGNLTRVEMGYDTGRILTMSVTAVEGSWKDFHVRALESVAAIPGVEHAAFAWGVPLTGNSWPGNVEVEGQPAASQPNERLAIPLRSVTPGYFGMLGQEVTAGRDVRASDDREATRVAVVNQSFVERYFPEGSALGKKIWTSGRERPHAEIVGVVRDGRTDDLTQGAQPEIYLSLWQASAFSKHLMLRTSADPLGLAGQVQRVLRSVEPTVAVENVKTLDRIRGDSLASHNFAARLLIGFAFVAIILTLGGLYGILSLSVASRRRELAIRSAVGARQRDVLRLMLGEGLRLIAVGVGVGLLAGAVLSRALTSLLFEVEPGDPATLAWTASLFAWTALLACWPPALRAARLSPLEALRDD